MGKIILLAIGALLLWLLAWPVAIEPEAWQPPDITESRAGEADNQALRAARRLAQPLGEGPEATTFDAAGRLCTGFADGRVVCMQPNGGEPTLIQRTGGRPLGLTGLPDGGLVVADAIAHLVRVDDEGVEVLTTGSDDGPFGFVDDVDRAADGRLYFSDASDKFDIHEVMAEAFESAGNGRLLRFDPATGETETLLDGLYFPNGVTLGPDDAYVVFNETTRYRTSRLWLTGPRAGEVEVLIDNLPGFPDNVTFNGRDRFWIALYAPRLALLDRLLPYPFARKVLYRLPEALHPAPVLEGHVVAVDLDGRVVAHMKDSSEGAYAPITSVLEHDNWLYFGSLSARGLARLPMSEVPLR